MEQYFDVETGKKVEKPVVEKQKSTREVYTAKQMKARHVGVAAAARDLAIPECTVRRQGSVNR